MSVQLGEPIIVPDVRLGEPITFNATLGKAGLWTGHGAPGTIIGSSVGDEYIDLDTGDIYKFEQG